MSVLGGIPAMNDPEYQRRLGAVGEMRDTDTVSSTTQTDAMEKSQHASDMEDEVEEMVRHLTRHSTHFSTSNTKNPFFEDDKETTWHPDSPFFKAKDWIRSLIAAQSQDPERFLNRSAGVAFKNLHVHGFGSPTDYQKDVFNALLSIGGMVRNLTGSGKQKVQILNNFNGLVRSGEMLVVLGRPGRYVHEWQNNVLNCRHNPSNTIFPSGCSTFLKTIAGEMSGIYVNDDSYMNYQGMPPGTARFDKILLTLPRRQASRLRLCTSSSEEKLSSVLKLTCTSPSSQLATP